MKLAFLGLGIMGSRMAVHLVKDHELTVWTRTPGKAAAWTAEHGGTAAASPAEAAQDADVVITMLVDGPQVSQILEQAAEGARPGTLLVDMSTTGPKWARDIDAKLRASGMRFVEAPVTGSSPKAADGTLTIMAGGEADDVAEAMPLFEAMGQLIVHAGPVGQGQLVKVINNTVAAANAATLAQALLVASETGADLDALIQVMAAGSGNSTMLGLKAQPMRAHDYTTLFKTEHMLKDVNLCLEEAQRAGIAFDAGREAASALEQAVEEGHGNVDFAAIVSAYEARSGRRIER